MIVIYALIHEVMIVIYMIQPRIKYSVLRFKDDLYLL